MEDRVVRALDVLAKATKASDGILLDRAAAAAESGSTSLCRPWSRRDFLARLRTFTPGRWFAKVTKREEQATCPSQSHSLTHSLCLAVDWSLLPRPPLCMRTTTTARGYQPARVRAPRMDQQGPSSESSVRLLRSKRDGPTDCLPACLPA